MGIFNKICITEDEIGKMVMEAVNELKYGNVKKAAEAGPNIGVLNRQGTFDSYQWGENNIANAINVIRDGLDDYRRRMTADAETHNKQYRAAEEGLDAIEKFFLRKKNQQENLEDLRDKTETSYYDELNSKCKELYPSLYDENRRGLEKFDWTNEKVFNDIVSQLSPDARDYFENYY